MNNVYKVVWNVSLQMFQVVSELTRGKTKSETCKLSQSKEQSLPKIGKIANICFVSSLFVIASPFVWADENSDIVALKAEVASLKAEIAQLKNAPPLYVGAGEAPTEQYIKTKDIHDSRKGSNPPNNNEKGEGAGKNRLDSHNYGALAIGHGAFTTHGFGIAIGANSYSYDSSLAIGAGSGARSQATAVGVNSIAENRGSALGFNSRASNSAIAIGQNATAGYFYNHIRDESVSGMAGIAIGQNANAKQGIAIGDETKVNTEYGIAIGNYAKVKYNGVALGESALVWKDGGVALGTSSVVNRGSNTIGYIPNAEMQPETKKELATFLNKPDAANFAERWKTEIAEYDAIMDKVNKLNKEYYETLSVMAENKGGTEEQEAVYQKALEEYRNISKASVAVTNERYAWEAKHKNFLNAKAQRATDLSTYLSTEGAVSVGNEGWIGGSGSVHAAITRQITNVAAGSEDTDAVNVAQLKRAQAHYFSVQSRNKEESSNYLNDGAKAEGAIAVGESAEANFANVLAIGYQAGKGAVFDKIKEGETRALYSDVAKIGSIFLGKSAGQDSVGGINAYIGSRAGANSRGSNNLAFGNDAGREISGDHHINIGFNSGYKTDGFNNVALGQSAGKYIKGINVVSIGASANEFAKQTEIDYAVSLGFSSKSSATKSIAIGAGANALIASSVALGFTSVAERKAGINGYDPLTAQQKTDSEIEDSTKLAKEYTSLVKVYNDLDKDPQAESTAKEQAKKAYQDKYVELRKALAWKSNQGGVSVGNWKQTRQVTNVAAGYEDTDAVNVAQLKALKNSGLKFAGNDYDAKNSESTQPHLIQSMLGDVLSIQGKSSVVYNDSNKANYSSDNLITFNDNGVLRIGMLNSPNFAGVSVGEGNSKISLTAKEGKLQADGSDVVTEGNLKTIFEKYYVFDGGLTSKDSEGKLHISLNKESLKNDQNFKGPKGDLGEKGIDGKNGKSALEIWKEKPENKGKSDDEFVTALKGEKGEPGANGKSAYDFWKELPGNMGKSEKDFAASLGGSNKNADAVLTKQVDEINTTVMGNSKELKLLRTEHDNLKAQVHQERHAIAQLDRNMQKMNRDLRAGIAGATAIAFLQSGNFAGESAVSVAVGTYKGENALAVGYGHRLKNNKVEVKFGASINGRSDMNAGGSVGYHW